MMPKYTCGDLFDIIESNGLVYSDCFSDEYAEKIWPKYNPENNTIRYWYNPKEHVIFTDNITFTYNGNEELFREVRANVLRNLIGKPLDFYKRYGAPDNLELKYQFEKDWAIDLAYTGEPIENAETKEHFFNGTTEEVAEKIKKQYPEIAKMIAFSYIK